LFSGPNVLSQMSWSVVFIPSHFSSTPSDATYLKEDAPSLNLALRILWHSMSGFLKFYFFLFVVFLLTFWDLILKIPLTCFIECT
jgi:hypothetical protein